MLTISSAVIMVRGTLMGGFSSRWMADSTESACMVENVVWPVDMAWNSVQRFLASDFAYQQVFGTLPECGLQQVEHLDGALAVRR